MYLKIRDRLGYVSNTSSNFEMTGILLILLGQEFRKRKTRQEKIAIIQQTMETEMTVFHVARLHSIQPNLLFKWKKRYWKGSLTAGRCVVPASELVAELELVRELQRLFGKKTMAVDILKEALGDGQSRKGMAQIGRIMSVSRVQLSLWVNRSADWQDRRCNRSDEEADE